MNKVDIAFQKIQHELQGKTEKLLPDFEIAPEAKTNHALTHRAQRTETLRKLYLTWKAFTEIISIPYSRQSHSYRSQRRLSVFAFSTNAATMHNFRRRKQKTQSTRTSSNPSPSHSASISSTISMCRSSRFNDRKGYVKSRTKRVRSIGNGLTGILRRPSWGGLVGLGGLRRIDDLELQEPVLPRTPAYFHLPATAHMGNLKRQAEPVEFENDRSQKKNDKWNLGLDVYGHRQKKQKKLRLLEELQQRPLKSKKEMMESDRWKGLDDLVDMAYKIRVSEDQYGWDKLLEEDIEEEGSDLEKEASSSELSNTQQRRQEQDLAIKFDQSSIYSHPENGQDRPAIGHGDFQG